MEKRRYVKVFGDMAAYLGLFNDDYMQINNQQQKMMDGARLHCLYFIQHFSEGCKANCAFCTQGTGSKSRRKESYLINNYLIKYPVKMIIRLIREGYLEKRDIRRICFSAVYNEKTNEDLLEIFRQIRAVSDIPLTACCIPDSPETLKKIKAAGADRVVINFETVTKELFENIRGIHRENSPYNWEKVWRSVEAALDVFGPKKVGSHILIGIGESQKQAVSFIQQLYERKISVSLFAFRPVPNTDMENFSQISYNDYHKVQLARYLIHKNLSNYKKMQFDSFGNLINYGLGIAALEETVNTGKPFVNMGGCPHCNRVHYDNDYNERYYNYPRPLRKEEIEVIRNELLITDGVITGRKYGSK